jgi:hypothetical protein
VNYVLYNFTNHLPFGTSLLNVALLTFGIDGTTSISQYYDNYKDFANEVATKTQEFKQFPTLKPIDLSEYKFLYIGRFLSRYHILKKLPKIEFNSVSVARRLFDDIFKYSTYLKKDL